MKLLEHPELAGSMYEKQGNDNSLYFIAFQGQLLMNHVLENPTIQMPLRDHMERVWVEFRT